MTDPKAPGPPPAAHLMQLITGHWVARAVHTAAELDLADAIAPEGSSSSEIAERVEAHGPSVYRLLRALASLGLFDEFEPDRFRRTPAGDLLTTDAPGSLKDMALFQGAPPHWQGWGEFPHSVRTGECAFERVHGKPFFDYCQDDEPFAAAFNGAMTALSVGVARAVAASYDFSGVRCLVDVGGGHGLMLVELLEACPTLEGVVMDLPHVAAGAPDVIQSRGLADRCRVVPGDFFEYVPASDAYILKHILHDWNDDDAVRILETVAGSMESGGRVLVVESVLSPGNDPHPGKMLDLEMLHATHGGRERTREEFATLFSRAGLGLHEVHPLPGAESVIEARAAR